MIPLTENGRKLEDIQLNFNVKVVVSTTKCIFLKFRQITIEIILHELLHNEINEQYRSGDIQFLRLSF